MATYTVDGLEIVPQLYINGARLESQRQSKLRNSPIVSQLPSFDAAAAVKKDYHAKILGLDPLDYAEADAAAATGEAETRSMNFGYEQAAVLRRSMSYDVARVTESLTGASGIDAVIENAGRLQARDEDAAFFVALNAAAEAGQFIYTTEVENPFDAKESVRAFNTKGEAAGQLKYVLMHSATANFLREGDFTSFVPASKTDIALDRYLGRVVIESDAVSQGEMIYAGEGLLRYGNAAAETDGTKSIEQESSTLKSNGWGNDVVTIRWKSILHIGGFKFTGEPANGVSFTNAELGNVENWELAKSFEGEKGKYLPLLKHKFTI